MQSYTPGCAASTTHAGGLYGAGPAVVVGVPSVDDVALGVAPPPGTRRARGHPCGSRLGPTCARAPLRGANARAPPVPLAAHPGPAATAMMAPSERALRVSLAAATPAPAASAAASSAIRCRRMAGRRPVWCSRGATPARQRRSVVARANARRGLAPLRQLAQAAGPARVDATLVTGRVTHVATFCPSRPVGWTRLNQFEHSFVAGLAGAPPRRPWAADTHLECPPPLALQECSTACRRPLAASSPPISRAPHPRGTNHFLTRIQPWYPIRSRTLTTRPHSPVVPRSATRQPARLRGGSRALR